MLFVVTDNAELLLADVESFTTPEKTHNLQRTVASTKKEEKVRERYIIQSHVTIDQQRLATTGISIK